MKIGISIPKVGKNIPSSRHNRNGVSVKEDQANNVISNNTAKTTLKPITSSVVYPDVNFVGRDNELAEIHAKLSGTPNKIFLVGIGGIGKSEIAKMYVKLHTNDYDTVLWIPFEKNLLSTFTNDNIFPMRGIQRSDYPEDSDSIYFYRKLNHFKEIANSKTLLIIDNFDVPSDEYLDQICSGEYAIIFTTRNHHISAKIPEINIGELSNEQNLIDLFKIEYKRPISETELQAVKEIIKLYDKHTLSIRLIAGAMSSQRITPCAMLEVLRKNHEINDREKRATNIIYERIKQVFHLSSLSTEEKALLLNLSLVSMCGITVDLLYDLCEFDDFGIIDGLIDKSWVIHNAITDEVFLHPIVEELALELIKETPDVCSRMLENLNNKCKYISENVNTTYQERMAFYQLMESIALRLYNEHPMRKNMQFCFARFLYGNAMYYQAAQSFESLLKENLYNAEKIHCYEKIVQCQILSGNIELAHSTIENAKAISSVISPENCSYDEGLYYVGFLHRCVEVYRALGDFVSSIEYANQAKKFYRFYNVYDGDSLAWTEYHLGRTLMLKGDLKESEDSLRKALDIFSSHNDQHAIACCYDILALIYSKNGMFDEALDTNKKAHELMATILVESHIDFANNQRWRGDIFVLMNNYKEAKQCYMNAMAIYKDGNHTIYEREMSEALIALENA